MLARITLALLLLPGAARAQCFNIDFGDAFGTPSSGYQAAAGQPGAWQTLLPSLGLPVPLTDTSGSTTSATIQFTWGPLASSGVKGIDGPPTGDDERLMDDWWWHNSNDYSTLFGVRFKGLEPGLYRVYSYAWWGDTGASVGRKTIAIIPRGRRYQALSGEGPWPGHQVLANVADGTYMTDAVISPDGQLRLDYHSIAFPSALNGIQLVKDGACVNTVAAPYCDQGPVGGCDPVVLVSGRPSASAAEELQVEMLGAVEQREGIFYFSTNGQTSVPWKGGPTQQCVQPPVQRTPVTTSGPSSTSCRGQYVIDFNAWMALNPGKAPPVGATVQMQLMTYDPAAPATTVRLLDAIEFTIQP